jgi:hypothetical protein
MNSTSYGSPCVFNPQNQEDKSVDEEDRLGSDDTQRQRAFRIAAEPGTRTPALAICRPCEWRPSRIATAAGYSPSNYGQSKLVCESACTFGKRLRGMPKRQRPLSCGGLIPIPIHNVTRNRVFFRLAALHSS